jgi:beta-glucosidase
LADSPAHITDKRYPGNEKVFYDEDIFVGYRYFNKEGIKPLFPFGFGLSFTSFKYENIQLDKTEFSGDETLTVSLDLENIGEREGAEIVQLYIQEIEPKIKRPEKELRGFERVFLNPKQKNKIQFEITKDALSYYDENLKSWTVDAGKYKVLIGSSSRDIRLESNFNYKE